MLFITCKKKIEEERREREMTRALHGLDYVVFMIMVVVMAELVSSESHLKSGPTMDPPSDCCHVVQKVDVSCLCSQVTPETEEAINMQKVTHVA